ncbi:MAG: hypothetical protein HEP71_24335 [Roseivirga sp.]|nr:hypothetical protein [Roseivirga sp.]
MKALLIALLITSTTVLSSQTAHPSNGEFKKLKCGLYKNQAGDIGFKTSTLLDDLGNHAITYQQYVYLLDKDDQRGYQPVAFREVVDTKSFKILNLFYCKDKNYIYAIHYTSGGAVFNATKQIDPKSFHPFGNSTYGSDGTNIYYRTEIMKMADQKSFKVITDSENRAYDKNNYYLNGEILPLKDARVMGFDQMKKKNRK